MKKRYFLVGMVAAIMVGVILFINAGQQERTDLNQMSDQELMEISQELRDQMYAIIERLNPGEDAFQ